MEIVKSNMINLEPFQLWYCGMTGTLTTYAPVTICGIPLANTFTLCVNGTGVHHFSIVKAITKWIASTLST